MSSQANQQIEQLPLRAAAGGGAMQCGVRSRRRGLKGAMDRLLASQLERLIAVPGSRRYRSFVKASQDTEATQLAVLREICSYAADTVYGREHGFAGITSYEQYCQQVPVNDYEDLRPYIERHARGEQDVLFPGKPLIYNHTSGTTAKPKLLPVTPYAFERAIKGRAKLWLHGLMRDYPGCGAGKSLSVVSPGIEGHTEDGTPYGQTSGLVYDNIPEFTKVTHSVPNCVQHIEDYDAKLYTMMRFAMACDITLIITGNPATVLNLVTKGDQWKHDIIRDIRDGTLKADLPIDAATRAEAEDLLVPAPQRAAELERLAQERGQLRPADYWPNLKVVHTFTAGNCRLVIPKLKPWFGDGTRFLDFGYNSSEMTSTDLIDRETDGSILQIQNALFEFCPLEQEELPKEERSYLMAHQLEQGRRYLIYISTFSGLYRYDMNDVLEVVGHLNQAPIVRFLYKGKGMTSMAGEKLSEQQLIEAVQRGAQRQGVRHEFFAAHADAEQSRYRLYIELTDDLDAEAEQAFARAVEQALCEVNIEYQAKLQSQRLKPLEIVRLGKNAFERFRDMRLAEGASLSQLKWLHLSGAETMRQRMDRLVANGGQGA